MKFKYTSVTIIIMLLGGFSLSYGSDSDYPIPRKIDDNSRGDGDCTSCIENYDASMGAVCCDQSSLTCATLEADFGWNCSGCECADDQDFVSMYGCTDPLAANYSEDAEYSFGTCWFPELTATGGLTEISLDWAPYGTVCEDQTACNFGKETLSGCVYAEVNEDCAGNCIATGNNLDENGLDCSGVCGGNAVEDICGICDGDGAIYECGCADMPDGACDCDGNVADCAGECGGDAEFDLCGHCNGTEFDNVNDCPEECEGEFDECGMCTGGDTGLEYNYAMDCLGVCPGDVGYTDAQEDECGVCDGGGKAACAFDGEAVCDLEECTIYYNVYKAEEGVDGGYDLLTGPITGTAFTDIGFEYINTFSYYVTYIDAWGNESSPSNTDDARPVVLSDFEYTQSTLSMAYSFGSIELLDLAGENIINTDDWVGAFNGDQCVGKMQINDENTGACDCDDLEDCATIMYLYGDDGSESSAGYLNSGDIPTFKIWDGSTNNYYGTDSPESDCLAFEDEEAEDEEAEDEEAEDEEACCSDIMLAADIFGCTDPESCTYDSDATVNDGSCLYLDCAGDCGGSLVLDSCDVCGGYGAIYECGCADIPEGDCDCDGNVEDCLGVCDGDAQEDECGDCSSPDDYNGAMDCAGVCYGPAELDACGDCDTNLDGTPAQNQNPEDCFPDGAECDVEEEFTDCGMLNGETVCEGEANWEDSLGNGRWDEGEEFEDSNGDGSYNGNQCEANNCDACGDCGWDNPEDCFDDGAECEEDNQCEALDCDICGECNGDGPGEYECDEIPDGFAYNQSSSQAFYNVGNAYDALGNTLVDDMDWVGVFNDTLCVGSGIWEGEGTQISVMGDDGYGYTDGYMQAGDIPTFKVYDASAALDGSEDSLFTVYPYMVDGDLVFDFNLVVDMELLLPEFSHFERQLYDGVNLLSFYVLPLEPTIDTVFESCKESIECVITEGSAACYDESVGWSGSVLDIEPTKGYWVTANDDCNLSFVGFNNNPSLEYTLHPGANLISYPAQGCAEIEASLDPFGDYFVAVFGDGNATMNTINDGWAGSLKNFCGGDGYWAILNDDLDPFIYNMDSGLGRTIDVYSETMPTSGEFKVNQSTEQAFYFVDEITLLDGIVEVGDWLLSYNGDILTGIRQWQGMMVDIPTMGASDDVLTAGYFVKGDIPTFKLLKQSTGEFLALDGEIAEWSSNGVFALSGLSENESAPKQISLDSAYPNPFNPATTISFGLAEDTEVSIQVYNIQGGVVETLANQYMEAGYHSVVWNADQHSSGIYFVKMLTSPSTGGHGTVNIQKLMLIK